MYTLDFSEGGAPMQTAWGQALRAAIPRFAQGPITVLPHKAVPYPGPLGPEPLPFSLPIVLPSPNEGQQGPIHLGPPPEGGSHYGYL